MSAGPPAAHAAPPGGTAASRGQEALPNDAEPALSTASAGLAGYAGSAHGYSDMARSASAYPAAAVGHSGSTLGGGGTLASGSAAEARYGAGGAGGAPGGYEGYPSQYSAYSHPSYSTPPTSAEPTSAYAHPLYGEGHAPAPLRPPPASAYSHPAYQSAPRSNDYPPYAAPYRPAETPYAHARLSGSGDGLVGTQLPPMSLALGQGSGSQHAPGANSLSASSVRQQLPPISTYQIPAVPASSQLSHYQLPRSASFANSNPNNPYHHPAYGQPQPPPQDHHATTFSHPAYNRSTSSNSFPVSATSSNSSGTSFASATTAATALSSLSAVASSAAAQIPKPSTSSSVPNSPWAGPPPPAHLSLGGLAKRRRSATDAHGMASSLAASRPGTSGETIDEEEQAHDLARRASVGSAAEQRRLSVADLRVDTSVEMLGAHKEGLLSGLSSAHVTPLQQRRGSDGTLLSLSRASFPPQHSSYLQHPHPAYAQQQQPHQPRTVVLSNRDGTTSTIKEPRASSPFQPSPPTYHAQPPSSSFYDSAHPLAQPSVFQGQQPGSLSVGYAYAAEDGAASNTPSPQSTGSGVGVGAGASAAGAGARRGRKRKSSVEVPLDEEAFFDGYGSRGAPAEKKFLCPHPNCGRAFARNFNLQSHIKSHQGIREFKCPECNKLFSRKHDCTRHCIAIHGYDKDYMAKPSVTSLSGSPDPAAPPRPKPIKIQQDILPVGEMVKRAQEKEAGIAVGAGSSQLRPIIPTPLIPLPVVQSTYPPSAAEAGYPADQPSVLAPIPLSLHPSRRPSINDPTPSGLVGAQQSPMDPPPPPPPQPVVKGEEGVPGKGLVPIAPKPAAN
ncbi:hypothetical protein JCM10207_002024 [Rhodosporidiobolus poonsookiae]